MNSSNEWARPRLPEYIATNASLEPERLAQRVGLARGRVDLVALAPDRNRRDPLGSDALQGDPVGHVRAEHHDLIGLAIDEAAQPVHRAGRTGFCGDIRPSARLASGWRSMLQ